MEEVVWPRHEVVLLPLSKAVDDGPIGLPNVSSQRRDLGLVPFAVYDVDEEGFAVASFSSNGSIFRLSEIIVTHSGADDDVVAFVVGVGHTVYPYLLRGLSIERPNQVWATDICYIPMGLD